MATQPNTKRMKTAIQRVTAEIASLTDWIETEVGKRQVTWANINSLESLRDDLVEILGDLAEIDYAQIQRSLDELHEPPN